MEMYGENREVLEGKEESWLKERRKKESEQ